MKEHYVSYECAKALKRLGFKEEVTHYYTPEDAPKGKAWFTFSFTPCDHNRQTPKGVIPKCSAPRLDQAQAWLRDCKGIDIEPRVWFVGNKREYRPYVMPPRCKDYIACPPEENYESALSAGIGKALDFLGKEASNA